MYSHPSNASSYPPNWNKTNHYHQGEGGITQSSAAKRPSPRAIKTMIRSPFNRNGHLKNPKPSGYAAATGSSLNNNSIMSFEHGSLLDASCSGSFLDNMSHSFSSHPAGKMSSWLSECSNSYIEMENTRKEMLDMEQYFSEEKKMVSPISSTSSIGEQSQEDIDILELYIAQPPESIIIPSLCSSMDGNSLLMNESIMTMSPPQTPTKTTISPRSRPRHHRVMPMVGNEEVDMQTLAAQKGRDRRRRNLGLVSEDFSKILENLTLN